MIKEQELAREHSDDPDFQACLEVINDNRLLPVMEGVLRR